ncbi:MAG: hypothetical protein QOF83_2916 [Solirubrobacteraceae bacterium]|nr:hypothetical protein [Solirubrobacteraceae bacterium]
MEFLRPYVEARAHSVSITGRGQDIPTMIESVAEARRLLTDAHPSPA